MNIPTPTDLDHAPELAVLAALKATLAASRTAVIAESEELRDPDRMPLFSRAPTGTVKTLLTLIDALVDQIDIYREKAMAEDRPEIRRVESL